MQRLLHTPVTLMYNASSYHALPSFLSDFHEVIGAINAAPNTTGHMTYSRQMHKPYLNHVYVPGFSISLYLRHSIAL